MLLARQGFDVVARRPSRPAQRHPVDPRPRPRRRRAARPVGPARRGPRQRRTADPLGLLPSFRTAASTARSRSGPDSTSSSRPAATSSTRSCCGRPRRRAPPCGPVCSVTGTVTDPSGRVTGVALRDRADRTSVLSARLVVGADGVRSRVARSVGARIIEERPAGLARPRTPTSPGSTPTASSSTSGDRSFAGVFPTHDGEANVWMCLPGDRARSRRGTDRERGLPLPARGGVAVARRARARPPGSRHRSAPPSTCRTTSSKRPARDGRSWATPAYHRTRSPATASPTPSATPSCSPAAPAELLRGELPEADALAAYHAERNVALARSST